MVSQNYRGIVDEFDDMAKERDLRGFAWLAAVGGGGALLGQEISQRVLPLLNMPSIPSTARGVFAAAVVNIVTAMALGFLALRAGGSVGGLLAGAGVGAVILGGINLFDAVQRSGFLAEHTSASSMTPSKSSSSSRSRPTRVSSGPSKATPTPSVTRSSSSGSRAAANGASFR